MPPKRRQKTGGAGTSASSISVFQFIVASLIFQFFLSYVITETWTWGYKSKWMSPASWKYLVNSPLNLTEAELAQYDGSDPKKPLYLAIDGDVYDVSSNRRIYGPGGSYGFFSGKDAARAFVTGCFKEDLTHDTRGLDPQQLQVQARTTVTRAQYAYCAYLHSSSLLHWKDFFAKSDKYFWVGKVHHPPIDPSSPFWPPCKGAQRDG